MLSTTEALTTDKKDIASRGNWDAHLSFGGLRLLKNLTHFLDPQIKECGVESRASGSKNLPLQDAALQAANVVGKVTCKNRERLAGSY